MPRTKEQFEQMRQATREKILMAGLHLFAHQGFPQTSVQDIADQAGISVGLIYRHFKSKNEIFTSLIEVNNQQNDEIIQMLRESENPKTTILSLLQLLIQAMGEEPEFFDGWLLIPQAIRWQSREPACARLVQQNNILMEALAQLIVRGQDLGQFRPGDPKQLASLFLASIQGLPVLKYAFQGEFTGPTPELIAGVLLKENL